MHHSSTLIFLAVGVRARPKFHFPRSSDFHHCVPLKLPKLQLKRDMPPLVLLIVAPEEKDILDDFREIVKTLTNAVGPIRVFSASKAIEGVSQLNVRKA